MIDPDFKRAQFEALKEANDQGRLVPEKRRGFTKRERAEVFEAFEGRCADCGCGVGRGYEIDHRTPLFRGGVHAMPNWQLLCAGCHREKTKTEATGNAKARRIEKRETQGPKPPQMRGRPFQKSLTKTLSGAVKPRKTPEMTK